MFHVYILELADGSLYTGQTKDLKNRLKMHRSGKGSKYVRARLPLELKYTENQPSRSQAMRREAQIKNYSRKKKLKLIANQSS